MPLRPRYSPTPDEIRKLEDPQSPDEAVLQASGLVICESCGKEYNNHMALVEPYGFLTRICDGRIVKL